MEIIFSTEIQTISKVRQKGLRSQNTLDSSLWLGFLFCYYVGSQQKIYIFSLKPC